MTEFPRIPTFDAQRADEDVVVYGLRALAYVMSTGLAGLLDDPALHAAQHAGIYAVAVNAECEPKALEHIQQARIAVAKQVAIRREAADLREMTQQAIADILRLHNKPDDIGGTRVPVIPRPPAGSPGGAAVTVRQM